MEFIIIPSQVFSICSFSPTLSFYFANNDRFAIQQQDAKTRDLIRQLGRAIRKNNIEEEIRVRQLLEAQYLKDLPDGAIYAVIRRTYDPIQAVQTGAFEMKTLKEYKKGSL